MFVKEKLTDFRKLQITGFDAVKKGHNMYALVEFDITDIRKSLRVLRMNGKKLTFFAYVLKAIALTIDENRAFNSMLHRNRLIIFNEVDIEIPIELSLENSKVPRKCIIRDAARKSIEAIGLEIDNAKVSNTNSGITGKEDEWLLRFVKLFAWIPKAILIPMIRIYANNPHTRLKLTGSTFVTSVSGFNQAQGFVIPFFATGPCAVAFALGNALRKQCVTGTNISVREYLSLTVVFNHDIIDGAPAARFINRLKLRIEGEMDLSE